MRLGWRCLFLELHLVSIHAPWEGCDYRGGNIGQLRICFNSRTLGRVRQDFIIFELTQIKFQFTHPGKGATGKIHYSDYTDKVSIHAPWEGCDARAYTKVARVYVSIHAPWEGCDRGFAPSPIWAIMFQFTHPGKGATGNAPTILNGNERFQFTHPGKGATTVLLHEPAIGAGFNSRTLGRVRQCGAKLRIIGRINKRNLRLGVLS